MAQEDSGTLSEVSISLSIGFCFSSPSMSSWNTRLMDCCGQPGGCGLCLRSCCCPCTVTGDINAHVGGPGGFIGGCCMSLCHPCLMAFLVPQVAQNAGFEESGMKACCCSCCMCAPCYLCQVRRECDKNVEKGKGKPMQMEMK